MVGSRVKFHPTDATAERIIKCSYKEFQRGISGYSSKPVMKCILLNQIKEKRKKIVLYRVYSGSWLSQSIIAVIYGRLSFGSFNCHHVDSGIS